MGKGFGPLLASGLSVRALPTRALSPYLRPPQTGQAPSQSYLCITCLNWVCQKWTLTSGMASLPGMHFTVTSLAATGLMQLLKVSPPLASWKKSCDHSRYCQGTFQRMSLILNKALPYQHFPIIALIFLYYATKLLCHLMKEKSLLFKICI